MKAITFDSTTPIASINRWWEIRKHLISEVRAEVGNFGITIWYTPKFKEAA